MLSSRRCVGSRQPCRSPIAQMLMPPPPCRASMQGPRHRQGEWRDRRVELRAVVADHAVAAFHGADRGGQYRARGIGELFARFDPWLFADHAVAADLLDIAVDRKSTRLNSSH